MHFFGPMLLPFSAHATCLMWFMAWNLPMIALDNVGVNFEDTDLPEVH